MPAADHSPNEPWQTDAAIPAGFHDAIAWIGFLAGGRPSGHDRRLVAAALIEEGPVAEVIGVENRAARRALAATDEVGRAEIWLAERRLVDGLADQGGYHRVVGTVVRRLDPVVVRAGETGAALITERSIRDWLHLRCLVAGLAGAAEPCDLNGRLLRHALIAPDLQARARSTLLRVAQAPAARAAVEAMVRRSSHELILRIGDSLAGLDPEDVEAVDQHIDRLWIGAELARMAESNRPRWHRR